MLFFCEAFNESVNYMTWSFYSLITAYVSMAFYDRVEVKTRINNYLNKLLFVIAICPFYPKYVLCFNGVQSEVRHRSWRCVIHYWATFHDVKLGTCNYWYRTAAQRLSFMSIVSWVFICFIRLRKMKSFNSLILNAKKFLNDQNYRVLLLHSSRG